jgi:hypothetical protein
MSTFNLKIRIFSFLFLLLSLTACNNEIEPYSQGACEECRDNTDCKPGLSCQTYFSNTSAFKRCGNSAQTTCRVPF